LLDKAARRIRESNFRLEPHMGDADRVLFCRMESWARGLVDILMEIAGMLHSVGCEAIEANSFWTLLQMLERGRNLDGIVRAS
jgi:hypothetical protein